MTHAERLARYLTKTPDISRALFVAANATINGDVVLGLNSSVFYGAVLRGDIQEIRVGEGTNIQDNAIVHLADDYGAVIGAWCTIGHAAIVHACTIGDECLIGMGPPSSTAPRSGPGASWGPIRWLPSISSARPVRWSTVLRPRLCGR